MLQRCLFKIKGILKKTGTSTDKLVLVSLEALEAIHKDWKTGSKLHSKIKNNEKELVVSYEKNIINIQEIINVIKIQKIDIFDVQSRDPDLEDVFIKLIKN